MVLWLIGLGLGDEKDITVRGLEAVKSCKYIYLEHYTAILGVDKEKLVRHTIPHTHTHTHRQQTDTHADTQTHRHQHQ